MKDIAAVSRVKVSADGRGVVSHAGMGLLRELADATGLSAQVTAVLADTYKGPWTYAPGAVFADLAAAVADGADCIDAVGQLCGDREHVFGAKASTTTMWRLVDQRIDAAHLPKIGGGLGRRSGPARRPAALYRHRRHPGHRPFRQQTARRADLEEVLRPSGLDPMCWTRSIPGCSWGKRDDPTRWQGKAIQTSSSVTRSRCTGTPRGRRSR